MLEHQNMILPTRRLSYAALGVVVCLSVVFGVSLLVRKTESGRGYHAQDFFSDTKTAVLAEAARDGDVEQVNSLISEGVDVNGKGKDGLSILMYSLSGNTLVGFDCLLEHGANPNQQTDSGESAMSFAAARKDPEALRRSLVHGGNPNLRNPTAESNFEPTPIFNAVSGYSVENARLLINAGADLNARDNHGNTPLMHAATLHSYDVMYLLLEAGADFRARNLLGYPVTYDLLSGGMIIPEVFGDRVDPNRLEESKEKCMDFLKKKGVDFEQEKKNNTELVRRIKERQRKDNEPDILP
jgi:uncharacterized protein